MSLARVYDNAVVRPVEALGLGSMPRRFAAFSVGGGLLMYYLKPSLMFDANGQPLPWSVTTEDGKPSTPIPLPIAAGLVGVMAVLFI